MNSPGLLKSNCVRMTILLAMVLAGSLLFMSLNVQRNVVHAQSCLITDKDPRTIPTPPSLPAAGGTFVDPTFCQTIMRVTDAGDGTDCHSFYSYWPTFNVDSTRFIYACDTIPKLGQFNPNSFQLISKGNLFDAGHLFLSTEDAIWSGSDPNVLYGHEGPRLWAYNVFSRAYTQVKDFSAQVPSGGYIWQMSKSIDDNVFAFTVKNSSDQAIGYLAWQRNPDAILRNVTLGNLDEVALDKTGRYLVVKAEIEPPPGVNCRIVDLENANADQDLTNGTPDYSPGHSDNGQQVVLGYDNWNNQYTTRTLANPHVFSTVILLNDWSQASHMSMLANNESWCVISNYSANPGSDANVADQRALRQEIFQAATDGSQNVRRLAHHHSVYRDYYDTPRANISRDGKFIAFTSNWGSTTRRDVFIIKVPPLDCTYSILPTSQSFAATAGTGSITVTATGGCNWTAVSNNTWITVTSGASGAGNGAVGYSVAANTGALRNGTITVAGQTFNISQAAGASGPENVIWTHVVNCTVTGNSIQKTSGCDGCDSGAWSQQSITSGNGYLEFTATETNKMRFGALTATPSTSAYTLLDFSIEFNGGSSAEVRENGVYKTDTNVAGGNVFRIAVESGVVKYYKNGTVFYTSTKTPSFPLYADAVMLNLNATITNAVILPSSGPLNVTWTNVVNCTVTGNSLQKTGGGDGGCNGGAWSQQSIPSGNGYVEFTATETNKYRFCSLTPTRSVSDYTLLDFSIELTGGYAEVRENGAYKTDTPYATSAVFRIAIESGVVKYYKNGTVFYTSTKTPSFPLYADAVMCGLNATITNAKMSGAQ